MGVICLALTGARGTGKSTLCQAVVTTRPDVVHISVSGWLRATLIEQHREATPEALKAFGAEQAASPEGLVLSCLRYVAWDGRSPLVFDAVRHVTVLEALRTTLTDGDVHHVGLVAPLDVLASRLMSRDGETLTGGTLHSTEEQIEALLRQADVIINTDRPVSAVAKDVLSLLRLPSPPVDHDRG